MRANCLAFALAAIVAVDCLAGDTLPEGAEQLGSYYQSLNWQVDVQPDGFREKVRQRFTILNPRGDNLAYLSVSSSQFHTLVGVQAEVFDSQGRKVYSKKDSDWGKTCGFGPSFVLYQDICTRYLHATGPGYPYTVEWVAEWRANSLFFWPGAYFQQAVPVVQAVYELKCPSSLAFQYKAYGLSIEPEVRKDGDKSIYRWTANDVAAHALQGDEYLTPEHQDYGRIVFAPESFGLDKYQCSGQSWNAIAAWARDMAKDRYLPQDTAAIVAQDPEAVRNLIGDLYRKVIENNRYVAISIGVGGWQPHPAALTEKSAFGDCKDLSTLLISYLRNRGLRAYPALVLTRSAGMVDPSFPSTSFNHVITMVPMESDTIWMDPTCETCPFGDLPIADEDIYVLAVTDDTGVLVRTPASRPDDNRLVRVTRIRISDQLLPSFQSTWTATGNKATGIEGLFIRSDAEERVALLRERLSRAAQNWSVELTRFEREQTEERNLLFELRGSSEKPLLKLGDGFVLAPFCFSAVMPQEGIDLSKRLLPVDLGYPGSTVDTVIVTWDRRLILDSIIAPKSDSCSYALGSCSIAMQILQDSAIAVMTSRVEAYELPVSEFGAFRSFCAARNRLAEACFHIRPR
jgi:transglutaminase-like putative cysteine protease